MSNLSKRIDRVVRSTQKKLLAREQIMPVKTDQGILVGSVLIVSNGALKDLWRKNELIYKEISLNKAAITLANWLAIHGRTVRSDNLYNADQEYGKWQIDSQMLRAQYQSASKNQDYVRADMLWARYCESRDKALEARNKVQTLIPN